MAFPWEASLVAEVVTSENSAEFYATRLRLAPEPAAATEPVEPTLESVETKTGADAEAEPEQQTDPDKKQRLNLRFSELTEKAKTAEADAAKAREEAKADRERASAAERRAAELQSKYEPPKPDNLGPEPQLEQFDSAAEWGKALKEWTVETAVRERDQKEAAAKVEAKWNERQGAFKAETPDYDATIAAGAELIVSIKVRDAILESDAGPQILYEFAKNPQLVADLKTRGDDWALRKVGTLEAKFEKTSPEPKEAPKPAVAATKISRAPAPIHPLKTPTVSTEPLIDAAGEYHGTFEQYKAARKAGRIK